jgi:hypothetical protein
LRLAFLAALLLGGCTMPPLAPRTVLDERTGASLTVVDQPLVLARERRDVAVQARDYLTLVAAEINESGRRQLVWVVHQWSTIDARVADFRPTPGATLLLVADGRDLRLTPIGDSMALAYAQNPALLAPEDANTLTTLYAVDAATLEFVATSRQVSATYPESGLALPFALWKDGRPAIMRFLDQIGASGPTR